LKISDIADQMVLTGRPKGCARTKRLGDLSSPRHLLATMAQTEADLATGRPLPAPVVPAIGYLRSTGVSLAPIASPEGDEFDYLDLSHLTNDGEGTLARKRRDDALRTKAL
jgi:hypothetical protein